MMRWSEMKALWFSLIIFGRKRFRRFARTFEAKPGYDIAKTDGSVLSDLFWAFYFWYKHNMSLIKMLIKQRGHTIKTRRFLWVHLFQCFVNFISSEFCVRKSFMLVDTTGSTASIRVVELVCHCEWKMSVK